MEQTQYYDAVVVGGGPAGLTAAQYLARAKYRVLVLEKQQLGGQIAITEAVENYPGIEKISGMELTEAMRSQAQSFGAEFAWAEVTGLEALGAVKILHTTAGDFRCFGILLATGAYPRQAGFAGEDRFKGRGVSYCATCDGPLFAGKEVFVIGGGYAAAEESVFLAKFARHVTVLIRRDDFSCAASVADAARSHEKITVLTNTVLEEISGERAPDYVRVKNTKTGQTREFLSQNGEAFGVFVFAGYAPATDFLKGLVELDARGYIVTDEALQTSVPGVFAAGDVRAKPLRQIVTATADGALAATALERYAAEVRQETGITPTT